MQYFIAFCSRPEAAGDVISSIFLRLIVPDKSIKFVILDYTMLEKFDPKPSEAAIITVFFSDNFQPEAVAYDVISGGLYGLPCRIWRLYVKPLLRYTSSSALCDGRTTNERPATMAVAMA